jgi:four helix bundle protein
MKDFRNLIVWENAHQLTLSVYHYTKPFPKEELYGLTRQIRRCCASIPANIAEGCGKKGNAEFHRYLMIATGSASELDYHLLLSRDLGYLPDTDYRRLSRRLSQLRRQLSALVEKVEKDRFTAKC